MDVIRDRPIVELNQNNVKVLETNLEATRDRFQIGDLTRTDVAQSEARLELGARSSPPPRPADSERSEIPPADRPRSGRAGAAAAAAAAPATPDEAVRIALANNPDLSRSAARRSPPAMTCASPRRAGCRPSPVSAANLCERPRRGGSPGIPEHRHPDQDRERKHPDLPGRPARRPHSSGTGAAGPGAGAGRGHGACGCSGCARRLRRATRRPESDPVRTVAVQANELALEGVRAEQSVGTRTVLDVLNAEQELLNSQVSLVTARRDAYVAGFQLLNAMGQAEARTSASKAVRSTIRSAITVVSPATGTTGRPTRAQPVATRTVTP